MSVHSSAAIVSIGDELTLGQKLDTNSQWLSRALFDRGIAVREHVTLADDFEQNVAALRRLCTAYPLVLCTGGLGPTADDLTRQALARVMGEELVEDERALGQIKGVMERRGRVMSENQRVQALRPRSGEMIDNPTGTAPGLAARVPGTDGVACDVFCLPGPPGELRPMFESFVVPRLRTDASRAVRARVLHCLGIGEGDLATRLGPLMDRDRNPLVGTTASGGVVSIRIRYEGPAGRAEEAMLDSERLCRACAGPFVFGEESQSIESVVLDLLRERGEKLVVVESCTGGLLGSLLTGVPGSSDAFLGGWVTYANELKSMEVGVPGALIAEHGAVSEAVAIAMARGGLRHCAPASHCLAITGIAGPGGGSERKPVGTAFIARASLGGDGRAAHGADIHATGTSVECRRFLVIGDRNDVRGRSARLALMMLRFHLLGLDVPRTLWQVETGERAS